MAKLPNETIATIFAVMRQLAEGLEEASAAEWTLFEQYGETQATLPELEELQNARERLLQPYSRLNTLLLRILESQPTASVAMLDLLEQTIEQGQASVEAGQASVLEVKRNWNLP